MAQTAPQHNDSAASSSSPSTSYDVFINHRGEDVKKTFASHLYKRLTSFGLQVFLDKPELEEGCTFPPQIEAAIQSAAIHIAVFSPTYANSQWCLDELISMLRTGATILPVFYNVEPWELRWTGKDGKYAEALREHEEKNRYDSETIQKWRKALSTAANISGFELKQFNGDEGELLEAVVQRVLNHVGKRPLKFVAEHPTGLEEKLKEFETNFLQQQKGNVVAIVGQGGVGKTTLAKQYFSKRRRHYSRSCFLYDVRENAANGSLHSLQRKLLKDLIGLDLPIDNIHEGIEKLLKHLSSSYNFLIILDDVDHARQLEPFSPIKDILSSNSLILITSRDKKISKIAKIAETSVYELKGLDFEPSKKLFCYYAFNQPNPLPGFADLLDGFSRACHGLPLSLKVFGALLFGEDRSYWQDKLNRLNQILHKTEIYERLKISYDSLSSEDQEIFLDIACFFTGKDIDTVIKICGSDEQLLNLKNKCLLELDGNKVKMHDQIRDMGRHIAEKATPRRFWHQTPNNIDDLLERSSCGNIEVRGIMMDGPLNFNEDNTRLLMSEMSWYRRWGPELFGNYLRRVLDNFRFCGILNLQLVSAEGDYLERILRRARAPQIRWIRWYKCTHYSLPSCIPMENLKVLEVEGNKLRTLWERESQAPQQLRKLCICAPLCRFPKSLMQLKNLVEIDIRHAAFKTLPEELCDVHSLEHLVLRNCTEMISLPDSLGNLANLQAIDLTNASSLQMLPSSFGNLAGLQGLFLRGCSNLTILPDSFGMLTKLTELVIKDCPGLECLPDSFGRLTQLWDLSIGDCPGLKCLPDSFGQLTELRWLNIEDCPGLKCLPDSFGLLTQLIGLLIEDCPGLKCLPDSFGQLTQFTGLSISRCGIEYLPQKMMNSLEGLGVNECPLRELPFRRVEGEAETELNTLDKCAFHGAICPNLQGFCPNLQYLSLYNCKELRKIGRLCGLPKLKCLYFDGCENIEEISGAEALISLEQLYVKGCAKIETIEGLGQLTDLKSVELVDCPEIRELPGVEHGRWTFRVRKCPKLKFSKSSDVLDVQIREG